MDIFENFNQKYIEKYQDRVELYHLIEKPVERSNNNSNIFESIPDQHSEPVFKPVEPPFTNQPTTSTINNTPADTIEESIDTILADEPVITSPEKKDTHEPGFVSYVLLGVLVAVVSLVFLYLIL